MIDANVDETKYQWQRHWTGTDIHIQAYNADSINGLTFIDHSHKVMKRLWLTQALGYIEWNM